MAFEVRRRIKGVEITHRDNGGIEKQQGDNDGREQINRVAMPFQIGKQSPSKYRMARWGLFEQTGEGRGSPSAQVENSAVSFISKPVIRQLLRRMGSLLRRRENLSWSSIWGMIAMYQ